MEKETAMKILKELHGKSLFAERTALETLIPELKESENERIRKRIIHALHGDVLDMKETNEALAWLEKQGEPKQEWSEEDEEMFDFFCSYLNNTQKDWLKSLKDRIKGKEEQQ